ASVDEVAYLASRALVVGQGGVGLRTARPLRRGAPLQWRPASVPAETRMAVVVGSRGLGEIGWAKLLVRAVDGHQRLLRKAGGRHGLARQVSDCLSNLLHVCRFCHDWIHLHPAAAGEFGWVLSGGVVAALEPVLYRDGEPRYLDDLGGVHAFEAVGA